MKKALLLIVAVAASAFTLQAQIPQLAYDINPGPVGSSPTQLTVYNGKLYFVATDAVAGREIFVFDGVAAPSVAYDTRPGRNSSVGFDYNKKMGVLNGKLYFAGSDDIHGYELMAYNGVGAPTLVADLVAGVDGSNVSNISVVGNLLYFSATTPASGNEMYIYDGVNPPVLQDINPGTASSSPSGFYSFNNKVYFSATDATVGKELLVYDPPTNAVSIAADISTGTSGSNASCFTLIGSKIYFYATTVANGSEIYSFDGTTVTRVTDLNPGAGDGVILPPFGWKGAIYFAGSPTGINSQLYKYDPGTGNTTLVYNINPGAEALPSFVAYYDSNLYFIALDATHGSELWVYDGSSRPTLVADLFPGNSQSSVMSDFQEYNGTLYFSAVSSGSGYELYSLNTTSSGINAVSLPGVATLAPNPTTGNTNLSLELRAPQQCSITLSDVAGKTIWSEPVTNYDAGKHLITLPLEGSAAGLYFYRLINENGMPLAAGRIVKQ